jgi:threonine dehydrogenase-like Zn-dependent dehydrogenase
MRELTFIERGAVEWREVPAPRLQGPGEVLVRPLAVATCDLDAAIIKGMAPFAGPFPLGHEFVAEVTDIGEDVRGVEVGERFAIPFQICCGVCTNCRSGLTDTCLNAHPRAMYGLGPVGGDWGGALSDSVRVPFPDFMLVPLPGGVSPQAVASVSDNMPDAYRAVKPLLEEHPGGEVLVVGGGGATSIGLYACAFAVTLGSTHVDYVDHDQERLELAQLLGANPIEATEPTRPGPYEGHFMRKLGPYPITVDASAHPDGLALAIRSTGAGGICTAVGIFYEEYTRVPLLEMYSVGMTLRHGRVAARAAMPAILDLIADGRFDPEPVTSQVVGWEDAVPALLEAPTKLIVTRERSAGPGQLEEPTP